MAGLMGISNQPLTFGQNLPATPAKAASAATNQSDTNNTSSSQVATIGANDFLTLLVTEMKNQDPTANSDPNQYVNQLVQVNSLEQLISINENLSKALGLSPAEADGSRAASQTTPATGNPAAKSLANAPGGTQSEAHKTGIQAGGVSAPERARVVHGNLSIPEPSPAAQRVGHALAGHSSRGASQPVK